MQTQYDWIKDQIAQGKTVLAYDRSKPKARVYRLKSMERVTFWSGDIWVHGLNSRGWTFALKPEGK